MNGKYTRCPPDRTPARLACRFFSHLLILSVLLSACAAPSGRIDRSTSASPDLSPENTLKKIRRINAELDAFKGIGQIEWTSPDGIRQKTRLAWLCNLPDKLRVELLDIAGRPAVSLSSDGQHYYYFSRADRHYERRATNDFDLEPVVSLSINIAEVMPMLAGRFPTLPGGDASLTRPDSAAGFLLELSDGWLGEKQKFYLDETASAIYKLEVFDPWGALRYRAELVSFKTIGEYRIPTRIILSNDDLTRVVLRTDRFWPGIRTQDAAFVLDPPDRPDDG